SLATPALSVDSARLGGDSTRLAGDSATTAADDTGTVRLYPATPRRGGVVFALAEGVTTASPRCTWKSAPIPCYRVDSGVVVTVPLPADEEAGTFTLTVDRPGGRIIRQVAVADHEFGRELIFLTDSLYRRATNTREIARDARAVRGIASVQSTDRRWSGRWRLPLSGGRSAGYGVERYYYRATDSTRSIALDREARTRGTFAADTSDAPLSGAPSWRHSGVDIPARRGASVNAPAAGMVVDVGEYILSGRTVLIDHGQGVVSAFFHLDTAVVDKGDMVRAGQRIGRVGATGLATGPHLHYGLYLHGKDVDPSLWRAMPDWMLRAPARADSAAKRDTSRDQRQ
ncbi:MAG TPA: M23 family metallopeptidase, partial [Gemmatimonadaceae bacterium]|nr:M23 family metallopeptidase [Gemmatimonadaceae bacterium]